MNAERTAPPRLRASELSAVVHPEVLLQHKDDALFLAAQRRAAVHAPKLKFPQLLRSDERLEAHLDGLVIAGPTAWKYLLREVPLDSPEAIFTTAFVALSAGNRQAIDLVLSTCLLRPEWQDAFVAAVGFAPPRQAHALLGELLYAAQPARQALGLRACAEHLLDADLSDDLLLRAVLSDVSVLRLAAFRAAGLLGRTDCAFLLVRSLTAADSDLRFAAAWNSARLGLHDRDVLETLREFAEGPTTHAPQALAMMLRCLAPGQARSGIERLLGTGSHLTRVALLAIGQLGDAALIPAALQFLDDPRTARLAAETFSTFTGISLNDAVLAARKPDHFEPGPNDDPADPDVSPDPDEGLPWPAPDLVRAWWTRHQRSFQPGTRYLCGQPLTQNSLLHLLHAGSQHHRASAALELAVSHPAAPFFPVHARARRQQVLLQRFEQRLRGPR